MRRLRGSFRRRRPAPRCSGQGARRDGPGGAALPTPPSPGRNRAAAGAADRGGTGDAAFTGDGAARGGRRWSGWRGLSEGGAAGGPGRRGSARSRSAPSCRWCGARGAAAWAEHRPPSPGSTPATENNRCTGSNPPAEPSLSPGSATRHQQGQVSEDFTGKPWAEQPAHQSKPTSTAHAFVPEPKTRRQVPGCGGHGLLHRGGTRPAAGRQGVHRANAIRPDRTFRSSARSFAVTTSGTRKTGPATRTTPAIGDQRLHRTAADQLSLACLSMPSKGAAEPATQGAPALLPETTTGPLALPPRAPRRRQRHRARPGRVVAPGSSAGMITTPPRPPGRTAHRITAPPPPPRPPPRAPRAAAAPVSAPQP